MNCLSKGRVVIVSLLLIFIISVLCAPAGADVSVATSTKVFFEKNGEPYNDTVFFTVTCYGFTYTYGDVHSKNYFSGDYEKRPPGSDNQTEVFSYSATVDHYGDEIYEPFYLNYRVIDYCSLCGETNGKTFYIENFGDSPLPADCSMDRYYYPVDYRKGDDICYMPTDQYEHCFSEENELKANASDSCAGYIERFDEDKTYPDGTRMFSTPDGKMVVTQEYTECKKEATGSVDLNCSCFLEEVACEDICDPDGNPIQRECILHYGIPADEDGNIIEATPGPVTVFTNDTGIEVDRGESFDPVSAILAFFGLV